MTAAATALGRGEPVIHRMLHGAAQRRWRGVSAAWPLAQRLRALPAAAELRVGGRALGLDLRERAEQRMYRGLYERPEFEVVARTVRPGDTCVDVGANIGLFTLLLSALTGESGHVVAVEPSPLVLDRLRAVTGSAANVRVVASAVGDAAGDLPLDVSRSTHAHATLRAVDPAHAPDAVSHVSVPVRRLDRVVDDLGFDAIDFLKVDVEGWERAVLDGAGDLVTEGRIGAVLFEVNPQWGAGPNADALRRAGYQLFTIGTRDRGLRWRPVIQRWDDGYPETQVNALAARPERVPWSLA